MVASRLARTIPILIAVCVVSFPAQAQYSGGTGEPNDPYQIATAEDLMLLGETPDDYDKHFILTADIDLDPNLPGRKVFDKAVIAPDINDAENWFQGTSFTGVFNGQGHTISYLTITGENFLGLFGWVEGEVKDLGVANVNIAGSSNVGALVGLNSGNVMRCFSGGGTVSGKYAVGALMGGNAGNVVCCYSIGTVNCSGSQAGGLVGYNTDTVSICHSTADVTGGQWQVGGLVGSNEGTVIHCSSTGVVSGDEGVGGLVGCNDYFGSIATSYSTGLVSGGGTYVGGLVGIDYGGVVVRCFWDLQTSRQPGSAGGIGLGATQMQDIQTYLHGGWDFVGETENGIHEVWQIPEGGGYPVLAIFNGYTPTQLEGAGTREDPYVISDALSLGAVYYYSPAAHYRLTRTIDLSGTHWATPIVPWFSGTFDGGNHTIVSLNIDGGIYLGLFGRLKSGAQVRALGVEDVNVTGHCCVGGLVGNNGGIVDGCYISGEVKGDGYIGGLVGGNGGTVSACYSTGTVSGGWGVGGLVGENSRGGLSHCYSMTSVAGSDAVGGLVGSNEEDGATRTWRGHVSQCYSTGSVEGNSGVGGLIGRGDAKSIVQCFWDIENSGQTTSASGTGKTTAEMQTASTFLEAGWDFVGETINGPNDIWKMWDGYDYPRLVWEPGPNTPLVFVDINDPGFYGQMSKYEVTNAQYCDFLNAALASGDITVNGTDVEGAGGSNTGADYVGQPYYRGDGSGWTGAGATNGGTSRIHYSAGAFGVDKGFGNHPVTYVSWYGAMAFANYYGYYLPTEDQWQAVADYDGTYIYGCGETMDPGIANYRNSEHPDGTTSASSFGVYGYGMSDMAGNVWEWASSGSDSSRIFLGGGWYSYDYDCAVSIRGDGIPYANYSDIGFRVCR